MHMQYYPIQFERKVYKLLTNQNIHLFHLFGTNWKYFVSYFASQCIDVQMEFLNIDSRMYNEHYTLKADFIREMQQLPGFINFEEGQCKVCIVIKEVENPAIQSFVEKYKYKVELQQNNDRHCCDVCLKEFLDSTQENQYQCIHCKKTMHITCWYDILMENSLCPKCNKEPDISIELFHSKERDNKKQVKSLIKQHAMNYCYASERLKSNFTIMELMLRKNLEFVTIMDKHRLDYGLLSSLLFDKYYPKYFTSLLHHSEDNIIYCNLVKPNETPNNELLHYLQENKIIHMSYCGKIGKISFQSTVTNNSSTNSRENTLHVETRSSMFLNQ